MWQLRRNTVCGGVGRTGGARALGATGSGEGAADSGEDEGEGAGAT